MTKRGNYTVYALILNKEPVYIGMTSNIKLRINQHRKSDKTFDSFYIIESRISDKKQALAVERTLIKFISAFGKEVYNTQAFFHLYYKQEMLNNG